MKPFSPRAGERKEASPPTPVIFTFLILDLLLHGVDGIAAIDIKSDRLSREGLDEYLHGHGSKLSTRVLPLPCLALLLPGAFASLVSD